MVARLNRHNLTEDQLKAILCTAMDVDVKDLISLKVIKPRGTGDTSYRTDLVFEKGVVPSLEFGDLGKRVKHTKPDPEKDIDVPFETEKESKAKKSKGKKGKKGKKGADPALAEVEKEMAKVAKKEAKKAAKKKGKKKKSKK